MKRKVIRTTVFITVAVVMTMVIGIVSKFVLAVPIQQLPMYIRLTLGAFAGFCACIITNTITKGIR